MGIQSNEGIDWMLYRDHICRAISVRWQGTGFISFKKNELASFEMDNAKL